MKRFYADFAECNSATGNLVNMAVLQFSEVLCTQIEGSLSDDALGTMLRYLRHAHEGYPRRTRRSDATQLSLTQTQLVTPTQRLKDSLESNSNNDVGARGLKGSI